MLNRPAYRGFTLIELMIGLTMVAIMMTLALPQYGTYVQNTKIRNAAESVLNGLQFARSEAVMRNTNVQFVLGTGSGWTVSVVSPVETLQSRMSEQGSVGVTVNPSPANATTVTFNSLGRVTANAGGSNSLTQVAFDVPPEALSPALSRDLNVTISPGGRVRMCDPNVTEATDARTCE